MLHALYKAWVGCDIRVRRARMASAASGLGGGAETGVWQAMTTDPISLLLGAHRRIEEQVLRLDAVAGTRTQRPTVADEEVAGVVRSVLDFFAGPGARHQEEEERLLLPRLAGLPAFAAMLPAIRAQQRLEPERFRASSLPGSCCLFVYLFDQ